MCNVKKLKRENKIQCKEFSVKFNMSDDIKAKFSI